MAAWPSCRTHFPPTQPVTTRRRIPVLSPSRFKRAVPAVELEERELVAIEGRVLANAGDTDDGSRVRLTIVQALGPPPGTSRIRTRRFSSVPRK